MSYMYMYVHICSLECNGILSVPHITLSYHKHTILHFVERLLRLYPRLLPDVPRVMGHGLTLA